MLTPFVQAIVLLSVIGFLLQMSFEPNAIVWFALWPGGGEGLSSLPWLAPWQLVSYSFLHGDLMHLGFNMLALGMFGSGLERVWGGRRLAFTWFTAVVTAGIAQLVLGAAMGDGMGPVIGASGGVFGVLLAYALVFPNHRMMLLIAPVPVPARVFVALYAGFELVMGLSRSGAGIAHFAHLGGLLGGWIGYRFGSRWL